MALSIHPYIMGAPHRVKYFREAIQHIRNGVQLAAGNLNVRVQFYAEGTVRVAESGIATHEDLARLREAFGPRGPRRGPARCMLVCITFCNKSQP